MTIPKQSLNGSSDQDRNTSGKTYLMISGHDYRSKRKANVHFIMRELKKSGKAQFISIGFSVLSLLKRDPRASLWSKGNKVETHEGIECYLWRTFLHPINLERLKLSFLDKYFFRAYASLFPELLRQWVSHANTIILESGMSLIFFNLIKKLNPEAKIIYLCSDALSTIGCSQYLSEELLRIAPGLDGIRIPSQKLSSEFSEGCKTFFVPHGMDPDSIDTKSGSPYKNKVNLVSIGSMLFDPTFFEIASAAFPDYTFHVIGGGKKAEALSAPNIKVYDEMAYNDTLPYIQHAHVGIAPYEGDKVNPYLEDTSMKLMQFGAYGIPAVCPKSAAGNKMGRYGYEAGNKQSIIAAINAALDSGRFHGKKPLSWHEVTERILHPEAYVDTALIYK